MPQFKLSAHNGTHQIVRARRVRRLGEDVVFEDRFRTGWSVVTSAHHAVVESVQRKITELNGMERWITQPVDPAYIPPAPEERRSPS